MYAVQRKYLISAAGLGLVAAAVAIPAAAGQSAQTGELPTLAYDLPAFEAAEPRAESAEAPTPVRTAAAPAPSEASVECMAKVVHHEAMNQPRRGQLAVAQALVNRLNAGGRFGDTICAVAAQRGQFFDVAAYRPRRDTAEWEAALDVSREALGQADEQVAPGALFFRAAYAPANSFFRTRQRVAQVGEHVFYR